jgi:hypothetical protein
LSGSAGAGGETSAGSFGLFSQSLAIARRLAVHTLPAAPSTAATRETEVGLGRALSPETEATLPRIVERRWAEGGSSTLCDPEEEAGCDDTSGSFMDARDFFSAHRLSAGFISQ